MASKPCGYMLPPRTCTSNTPGSNTILSIQRDGPTVGSSGKVSSQLNTPASSSCVQRPEAVSRLAPLSNFTTVRSAGPCSIWSRYGSPAAAAGASSPSRCFILTVMRPCARSVKENAKALNGTFWVIPAPVFPLEIPWAQSCSGDAPTRSRRTALRISIPPRINGKARGHQTVS